jgi:hypothetical protein
MSVVIVSKELTPLFNITTFNFMIIFVNHVLPEAMNVMGI